MARIQRAPLKYREFLRVYGDAPEPQEVPAVLSPVIDARNFYLATIGLESVGATPTFTGVGAWGTQVVPAGELWLVETLGCRVQSLAAGAVQASLVVATDATAAFPNWTPVGQPLQPTPFSGAGESRFCSVSWPNLLPLTPGQGFAFYVGFTTANQVAELKGLVYRLRG